MINATALTCILVIVAAGTSDLAADGQPFHALYDVYRNGKLTGELDVAYERQGDHWTMRSEGRGTHGLARFLRAQDNEYADGDFEAGRFRPQRYTHQKRVAGVDDEWSADFDWEAGTVAVTRGSKSLILDMQSDTFGALSLKLELQRRLRDPDPDLEFMLVGKDKLKEQVFRVLPPEQIETRLGCLKTIQVERIRLGSTRYSRAWYASALEFIMVRLEHGKGNGDDLEMRITSLTLGQQEVKPRPECSATREGS